MVAILDELADADRAVTEASGAPRGLIRIACPMSLGLTRLMPAITSSLVKYPELCVDLEMNDRVVDVVREGFDLAIRGGGALADSTLVARRLATLERFVVASPHYLARAGSLTTPADLSRHRCLVYSGSSTGSAWMLVKGATKRSIEVAGPLRINSSLALVKAAVAGLGLALVPAWTVERELEDGRLTRALPDWRGDEQALYAVYPRHREISRTLRLVVDHMVEMLRG